MQQIKANTPEIVKKYTSYPARIIKDGSKDTDMCLNKTFNLGDIRDNMDIGHT